MFQVSAITVLTLMVFWGQIQNYMMRTNLSILIVAMVKDPKTIESNATRTDDTQCLAPMSNTSVLADIQPNDQGSFEWTEFERGLVLSAFGYGYIFTQIIGGRLAEHFGSKRVYGLGLFVTGVLTFLSPPVAHFNVVAFVILRICQGFFEGVSFPSLHALTARWVPIKERNRFIARSYFGTNFGLIITFPLCGLLVDAFGWESAFYVIGAITTVWFICWCFLVYDSPDDHPRIAQSEKNRINMALKKHLDSERKMPVPWKSILTSVPFWGVMASDCSNTWGFNTLGSNGPTYMKFMLGLDIKAVGFLFGLPMLSRYIGSFILGTLADWLHNRGYLRLVNIRRIFNLISEIGPAIALIMLSFSGCDTSLAITLLCVGLFFNGAIASGHMSSHIDLSPNFAGTMFGITNTFAGGGTNFLVPVVIGIITNNNMTFAAWRMVFLLAAVVYFFGTTIYMLLIRADVQPWNYPEGVRPESRRDSLAKEETMI